eukprot:s6013_g1.t1
MPRLVGDAARVVDTGKLTIDELAGNVASKSDRISIALVKVVEPTSEPWLTLHYDEWMCVLKGRLVLLHGSGESLEVLAGQTVFIEKGERFRPTFPDGATEYIPVCLPAFRPDRCIREEAEGAVSMRLEQLHGGRHAYPCTVHSQRTVTHFLSLLFHENAALRSPVTHFLSLLFHENAALRSPVPSKGRRPSKLAGLETSQPRPFELGEPLLLQTPAADNAARPQVVTAPLPASATAQVTQPSPSGGGLEKDWLPRGRCTSEGPRPRRRPALRMASALLIVSARIFMILAFPPMRPDDHRAWGLESLFFAVSSLCSCVFCAMATEISKELFESRVQRLVQRWPWPSADALLILSSSSKTDSDDQVKEPQGFYGLGPKRF